MKSPGQSVRAVFAVLTLATLLGSLVVPISTLAGNPGGMPRRLLRDSAEGSSDETIAPDDAATRMRLNETYGKLPLSFEPNQGQADAKVKFLSRGSGYTLLLTATEAVLRLNKPGLSVAEGSDQKNIRREDSKRVQGLLRMKLIGANPTPLIAGTNDLPGKSNYLIGNDPAKWRTDIPAFARVEYKNVYPGIDLVYYGTSQRELEYDFLLAPGANPEGIRLRFDGADQIRINKEGNLLFATKGGEVTQRAPVIYQEVNGARQTVAGRYVLRNKNEVRFEIGDYDRNRQLIIDPQLIYATLYGGNEFDVGRGIAVDSAGNAYVVGNTSSPNLPLANPIQNQLNPSGSDPNVRDAFVVKFNSSGTGIVYATYLGGRFDDTGEGIALTGVNRPVITGQTGSFSDTSGTNNFPTTANAFQRTAGQRQDAFVTMLSSDGRSLFYSTFLRGSFIDAGQSVAVDSLSKIYVSGFTASTDFPIRNGFQTTPLNQDAFVTKLDPLQSGNASLLYSSFLGGSGQDFGSSIAVDSAGNAYVCGNTNSTNFPVKSIPGGFSVFQTVNNGVVDAFVSKINPSLTGANSLVFSTYFGGANIDRGSDIGIELSTSRIVIVGVTDSDASTFPLMNAFDSTQAGNEAFIAKLSADGTGLVYSSYLGGSNDDRGEAVAIDSAGNAYLTGSTSSGASFPTVNPFVTNASGSLFIAKVDAPSLGGSPRLLYSTRFPGRTNDSAIALDSRGNVYVTGVAGFGFPATPGAFQSSPGDNDDAFVIKVASTSPDTVGVFRPSTGQFLLRTSNTAGPPNQTISFGQLGDLPIAGDWNADGADDLGVFRPSTGQFLLRIPILQTTQPCAGCAVAVIVVFVTATINFGQNGDLPVVGDWDGNGGDTFGVFRNGRFLLTNGTSSTPSVDFDFLFGAAGDRPIAGDWNGDGLDSIGTRNSCLFNVRNSLSAGPADITHCFGNPPDLPVTGDWDGDGIDTPGVLQNNNGTFNFFLVDNFTVSNIPGFPFGQANDIPVAGVWANQPPNSGVNSPSSGSSVAGATQIFTTTCSDPDGWHDIHTIDFKMAKSLGQGDGVPIALWVQFDENRNMIRFYDPDLQIWSEGEPGSPVVLSSRFADLNLADTIVTGSGPTGPSVQITWSVILKDAAVRNNYRQYLRIDDDGGFSTDMDQVGTWSVR